MSQRKNGHSHAGVGGEGSRQNSKFLNDLNKTIRRLHDALGRLRVRKGTLAGQAETLSKQYERLLTNKIESLIPSLDPRVITNLNIDVPRFLTPQIRADIEEARYPKIPFWTWFWGNSRAFRDEKAKGGIAQLRMQLRRHLQKLDILPAYFHEAIAAGESLKKVREDFQKAMTRENSLKEQIAGLERIGYSFGDRRPVPPKVAEAVSKAANSNPNTDSTIGSGGREFNYIDDVLIPNEIWNSVFHPRGDYYYDHPRHRKEDWSRSRPDDEPRPSSGGNASTRMDDAAPAQAGNASMRLSEAARVHVGNPSVRMHQDPVIAEPFRERGNASVSMAAHVHEDRAELGRGTKY